MKKFLIIIPFAALLVLLILFNSKSTDIPGLPPDPGTVGKKTLAGIDSNNDGLRDDIERYITINYHDEPDIILALRQYAKAVQNSLFATESEVAALAAREIVGRARECLRYVDNEGADAWGEKTSRVLAEILNTDARSFAYIKYNSLLGGNIFTVNIYPENYDACDFIPSVETQAEHTRRYYEIP